ncbi:hypothetical protein HY620_02805 [Candidatus Uhrbacteria bacterium]|nr:hypothetical protein [Candidatus Uhrbacteria bacterium]
MARKPSKQKLIRLLSEGDDSKFNTLVIFESGQICLISCENSEQVAAINYQDGIAVRYTTFTPFSNDVGPDLAHDSERPHINRLYQSLLEGWNEYRNTNEKVYVI